MISPKSIEEVVEASRVEQVLEDFVDLRRSGSSLKGLCPFHDEKTPSFMVSPAKGIYKCFGCGQGGDSVRFLMEHEKLSYPEAIKWLASKFNITIEETELSPQMRSEIEKKESLFIINEFAQKKFEYQLFETDEGKSIGYSYFKERKFDEKTIKKWGLGYAQKDRTYLYNELSKNQYNLELAEEIGVIKNKHDFFAARVTFPIRNLSGKVIGFGARTLSSNKKVPKYLNSPESEIYNKRKVLFGIYFAKTEIRKKDNCLMVEGYTDVLRLSQAGIDNVVASSGTSLTKEQIKLVKRFSQNITILYDGDTAGIKAALRGLDLVLAEDMNVRLVLLPDGEDPDSYLSKVGAEDFKEYIDKNAKDFILFKIDLLLAEAGDDPIKKSKVIKDIIGSIAHIPDMLKRNIYVKSSAQMLDLDESIIQQETNKVIKELIKKEQKTAQRNQFHQNKPSYETNVEGKAGEAKVVQQIATHEHQERDLMRIIFNFCERKLDMEEDVTIVEYVYHNVAPILEYFENPLYKLVIEDIKGMLEESKIPDQKYWLQHSNPDIKQAAIELSSEKFIYANWKSRGIELQTQAPPENNFTKDAISCILRIKSKKLRKVIKLTEDKIQEIAISNPEEVPLYIKAYTEFKNDLAQINKILGTVVLT